MDDSDLNDNWLNIYRLAFEMFGAKPTPAQLAEAREAYADGRRPSRSTSGAKPPPRAE